MAFSLGGVVLGVDGWSVRASVGGDGGRAGSAPSWVAVTVKVSAESGRSQVDVDLGVLVGDPLGLVDGLAVVLDEDQPGLAGGVAGELEVDLDRAVLAARW